MLPTARRSRRDLPAQARRSRTRPELRSGGQTQPFGMHLHAFPVPGPHNFGGADARFGAPRSGHIHQGQDIPAACGQKEIVDETGQVRVNAYQAGGAGYYVVLHGGAHRAPTPSTCT